MSSSGRRLNTLLLDYVAAVAIANPINLLAGTWANLGPVHNFIVGSQASIVEIAVHGSASGGASLGIGTHLATRLYIDSLFYRTLGTEYQEGNTSGSYQNPFSGGGPIKMSLTPGAHTVQVQAYASANSSLWCRPNGDGVSTEHLRIQVTEWFP